MTELRDFFDEIEGGIKTILKKSEKNIPPSTKSNLLNLQIEFGKSRDMILSAIKKRDFKRIVRIIDYI